jgi:hypothetical protein
MTMWTVHLTARDLTGERTREPYGAFDVRELPAILERVMRRAREVGGGVQITRVRARPGSPESSAAPGA